VSDLLFAADAIGLSAAVMYAVCLRPMRHHHRRPIPAPVDPAGDRLARLRREVTELRAHRQPGQP